MQELCARHAQTFAPLGITLEPWVNLLKGRAMKFPGLLLAYTPANAPAVVVSSIGARKNTAPIAGNFGASYSQKLAAAGLASKAAPPARTLAPTPGSMSTRVALAESGDSDQFDVTFDSG